MMNYLESISPRPVLFIMGENAHSKYYTEEAYEKASEPKELIIVPGARHIDLYDREDMIPFDKLESFFRKTCKKQDRQSCSTGAAGLLKERFVNTKLRISILFFGLVLSILCTAGLFADEKESKMEKSLSTKQEKAAAIAAFTANGDITKLKRVLNEGLDSGLTVNEIGEILLQMYAYAGFPRSLNGINTLSSVLEERKAKGIDDPSGNRAGQAA